MKNRAILYQLHIMIIGIILHSFISLLLWIIVMLLGSTNTEFNYVGTLLAGIIAGGAVVLTSYRSPRYRQFIYGGAAIAAALVYILNTPLIPALLFLCTLILSFLLLRRYAASVSPRQPGKTIAVCSITWCLRCFGYVFIIFIVIFPLYYMFTTSMKPRAEMLSNPLDLSISISKGLPYLLSGYKEVLVKFSFLRYILNSAIVSFLTVLFSLLPSIAGAYAVTRLRFPGRNFLSQSILLIYMFPAIVLALPLYTLFTNLGIRDSLLGLLIIYPAMTIPVSLYMLRSYFQSLPADIEEAGLIDGCNRGSVILRITLPLSMPAITSVALYVFMIAWNEFLFAFMMLDTPEIFTLSRSIASLNTQEVPRQYLAAGSMIITAPVMILFFWFHKLLVGGLTAGSVKG